MALEEVVQKLVWREFGQFTLFDPPEYDPDSERYMVNLRSDYPIFIHDDRGPSEYKVRVLKIRSLGQLFFNNQYQIIRDLSINKVDTDANLESLLRLWREQAENIVVTCSAYNLMRIDEFRNHFSQIDIIIDYLKEFDRITPIDLKRYRPKRYRTRFLQYINLLKGLEVIREEESGVYVPGRQFSLLEERTDNYDQFKKSILSHVVENRYITIRDVFKLTILEKTISIDNVIYLPELEIEEPIHRKRGSIANLYKKYYDRNIDPFKLNNILKRLENVEAISRKGDKFFGEEQLREKMLKKKKDLPELTISQLTQYM
jgi:hypothetical protein